MDVLKGVEFCEIDVYARAIGWSLDHIFTFSRNSICPTSYLVKSTLCTTLPRHTPHLLIRLWIFYMIRVCTDVISTFFVRCKRGRGFDSNHSQGILRLALYGITRNYSQIASSQITVLKTMVNDLNLKRVFLRSLTFVGSFDVFTCLTESSS